MRAKTIGCGAKIFRSLIAAVLLVAGGLRAAAGENYALLVAVGDYDLKELRPLKFTRADILDFQKMLVESGFPERNIVLMHDDLPKLVARCQQLGPDVKAQDYLPEGAKIRRELELLLNRLRADDAVVVAFAGHGVQFRDDKRSYYCPADTRLEHKDSLIALEEVYSALKDSAASRKMLLVDACQNDPQSSLSRSRKTVDLESVTRPPSQPVPEGVVALFSCKPGQKSFEMPELGHGIFFYHVLEGWKGNADANKDGKISHEELARYAERQTADYAAAKLKVSQTPLSESKFSGGDWILRSIDRADPLPVGSVWVGDPKEFTTSLTVTKREGETFEARFTAGAGFDRIVRGTVANGAIGWFRKDVQSLRGGLGNDNLGTISGDEISIAYGTAPNPSSGKFTLRRMKVDAFQKGSVWLIENVGSTVTVIDRKDGTFVARMYHPKGLDREIKGTVSGGVISWFAKDVRAKIGTVGGDNYGAIRGETIDMSWSGPGTASGMFTLKLQKPQ